MDIIKVFKELNDHNLIFDRLFSPEVLEKVFIEKFSGSLSKGVDRLSGPRFKSGDYRNQLRIASEKCINGVYRFSPYLEVLKLKGRGKAPRVISVPTIRDRVVLHQLNLYIANIFQYSGVVGGFARQHISEIISDLSSMSDIGDTYIYRTDIKVFYDSIDRSELLSVLSRNIECQRAIGLISHALVTPTVPSGCKRTEYQKHKLGVGVPQGLAISNILASIYMKGVDEEMKRLGARYYRYVDDVLIFGNFDEVASARDRFKALLVCLKLELHAEESEKSAFKKATDPFEYLGYSFRLPKLISVRDSSKEKFLRSIVGKFSEYIHNKDRKLKSFAYLDEIRLKEVFLLELNDLITGALAKSKCYGWIAYFCKINDMKVLSDIDRTIARMFWRLTDFDRKVPSGLKTVRRAYFEMRYSPEGGYIRNYDKIKTYPEKIKFLEQRGQIAPEERLTDEQIDSRFNVYVRRSLLYMSRSEGGVY